MSREEFDVLCSMLLAYWPANQTNAAAWALGQRLVGDLEFEFVSVAVDQLAVEEPRFMPGFGRIRERTCTLFAPQAPTAHEAWGEVLAAMNRVGRGGQPDWSHPLIAETVGRFRWSALCRSENLVADRAHFVRVYEEVAERDRVARISPPTVRAAVAALQGRACRDAEHRGLPEGK